MSDRRGTSVPAAEQRKFQKEQQLKARSKAAHQSPTARRATAAETKRKAFEKKHGKGMKPVPTRPPSRGAVAGARIGKAVKAKGSAAIAAFRKKAIAAKRAADARKRNAAPHKLKKIPKRPTNGLKRTGSSGHIEDSGMRRRSRATAARNAARKKIKPLKPKKKPAKKTTKKKSPSLGRAFTSGFAKGFKWWEK